MTLTEQAPIHAFERLNQVVVDLRRRGRQTLTQGVKPMMQRRWDDFDERQLGYTSFGAFVAAAEQAGYVKTRPWPKDARELEILPLTLEPGATQRPARRRVREDLWRAFTDWDPQPPWRFDRRTGQAIQTAEGDEAYVTIVPLSREEHLKLAEEFLVEHDSHATARLLQGHLNNDVGFELFSRVVNGDDRLGRPWRSKRRERVAAWIEEWAAAQDVPSVDVWGAEPETPTEPQDVGVATPSAPDRVVRLRAFLHQAIDQLPEHDLEAIRIPAGVVADLYR